MFPSTVIQIIFKINDMNFFCSKSQGGFKSIARNCSGEKTHFTHTLRNVQFRTNGLAVMDILQIKMNTFSFVSITCNITQLATGGPFDFILLRIPSFQYTGKKYGLDDRGSIPGRGNDGISSLRHPVQTSSGAPRASYQRYRG
jgi:hypothetical protein